MSGNLDYGGGGGGDTGEINLNLDPESFGVSSIDVSGGGSSAGGGADAPNVGGGGGGNLTGRLGSAVADATGFSEFEQSETYRDLRQQRDEGLEQGGIGGVAQALDAGGKATADLLLDNPEASVQDTTRGGLATVASAATGEQQTGEDVGEALSDAYTDVTEGTEEAVDGTALDNPVTDAGVFVADALVGNAVRGGVAGTTGVDLETGDTEGTVGPEAQFDALTLGLGSAVSGGGKAAAKLASSSDEAATGGSTLAARVSSRFEDVRGGADDAFNTAVDRGRGVVSDGLGGSDEAAAAADEGGGLTDSLPGVPSGGDETASRTGEFFQRLGGGADEAATAADDSPPGQQAVDEAIPTTDELASAGEDVAEESTSLTGRLGSRLGDELQRFRSGGDEAAGGADDLTSGADETSAAADDAGRAADDPADVFRPADDVGRGGDEAGSLADDASRGADDAGTLADDAARGADDGASLLERATPGRLGTGILAAVAGAGAATLLQDADDPRTAPDEVETAQGIRLTARKEYEPTERFTSGGKLYAVSENFETAGYWLLLGVQGRNLIVLDSNGQPRKAKISAEQFQQLQRGN